MKKRKPNKKDRVYIFEVKLNLDSPKMWDGKINLAIRKSKKAPAREIMMLGEQSLYDFADAINDAFGFMFDHCFGFYDNVSDMYKSKEKYELFVDCGEEYEPGTKSVEKTKISGIFKELDKKMLFFFDYGDGWEFFVELKNIESPNLKKSYPLLLKSIGKNPEQYPVFEE